MTRIPLRRFLLPVSIASAASLLLWISPAARTALAAQEAPAGITAPAAPYDWLQNNGDARHSGNNTQETVLGQSNVASLAFLFQSTLPSAADGAPVALSGVSTPGGVRDLLFVTTKAGHIVALDAISGAQVWSHQNGPGSCKINNGSSACFTTSSPAIDPNRQYVYSYGLDGYVHKYQVGDGTEITGSGWPELATLKGFDEKGSARRSPSRRGRRQDLPLRRPTAATSATAATTRVTSRRSTSRRARRRSSTPMCSDQTVHFVHSPAFARLRRSSSPPCGRASASSTTPSPTASTWPRATGRTTATRRPRLGRHGVLRSIPTAAGPTGTRSTATRRATSAASTAATPISAATARRSFRACGYPGHLAVQSGKDGKLRLFDLDELERPGRAGAHGRRARSSTCRREATVQNALAVWVNPADSSTGSSSPAATGLRA